MQSLNSVCIIFLRKFLWIYFQNFRTWIFWGQSVLDTLTIFKIAKPSLPSLWRSSAIKSIFVSIRKRYKQVVLMIEINVNWHFSVSWLIAVGSAHSLTVKLQLQKESISLTVKCNQRRRYIVAAQPQDYMSPSTTPFEYFPLSYLFNGKTCSARIANIPSIRFE